jgi:hypothetical protein
VVQQLRAGTMPTGYPEGGGRYVVNAQEAPSLLQQLFGSGAPVPGFDGLTFSLQVQARGMNPAMGGSVGFTFEFKF